ncbi:MAG: tetratricopeptide repeat protein [Treponema sp.]|nr:tetratricopeptide repeat protein [Treponema sp.]
MKKTFTIILFFLTNLISFAWSSEISVYDEVSAAYNSKFYPGVVEKAEKFQKSFPDSVYDVNVKLMQGQALINLFRYQDAIKILTLVEKKLEGDSSQLAQCLYLQGLANYFLKDYKNALPDFYKSCQIEKAIESKEYYDKSLLYTARIYYSQEEFSKALPILEYIIKNGNSYAKTDFDEALQKLINTYGQLGMSKQTISLYQKLSKEDFSAKVYFTITLYAAQAYEESGDYKKAYDLYCQIVESGQENLSVIAMKLAYRLSSEKNIADPAEIFSKAVGNFQDSPDLVCDFWIRLGIDEFDKKNYQKASLYFTSAKDYSKNPSYQAVLLFYDAKLAVELEGDFTKAENILGLIDNPDLYNDIFPDFSDSYYTELMQVKILLGKLSEVSDLYKKIQKPVIHSKYLNAYALYKNSSYTQVQEFLSTLAEEEVNSENLSLYELYASALSKLNKNTEACKIYEKINQADLLSQKASFEYAKNLFYLSSYSKACNFALKSDDSQKDYFCGLCMINLKDWNKAQSYFISYIKSQAGKEAFNFLSYYYKGYTEYLLGDFKNAYLSFIRFTSQQSDFVTSFSKKACEYAAKSALQIGDFKNAQLQAEKLIKFAADKKEEENAILFCVEIYSNSKDFDKALSLLKNYSDQKSEFGQQCLYQLAKIYEKKNEISLADQAYSKLFTEFPNSPYAQEAMYNLGQLYYSHQDYSMAEVKFNNYIYTYSKGKFIDSALFLCADSNFKLGNITKSIQFNKILISDYSQSIYLYGAYKNLLEAFYLNEDYSQALTTARAIVKNYPNQAAKDEIGRKIIELERILGGTDKKISEKISEYEKLGKASSKEGRIAGSELVKYYAADSSLQREAYELAQEIIKNQTGDDETYLAAQNTEFIASYERKNQNNEKAASLYLKAAELYRKSLNSKPNEAASVLYSAVEAYKLANKIAEAQEISNLLNRLYPSSAYANRARSLLK